VLVFLVFGLVLGCLFVALLVFSLFVAVVLLGFSCLLFCLDSKFQLTQVAITRNSSWTVLSYFP